jgi:hypothetical protein
MEYGAAIAGRRLVRKCPHINAKTILLLVSRDVFCHTSNLINEFFILWMEVFHEKDVRITWSDCCNVFHTGFAIAGLPLCLRTWLSEAFGFGNRKYENLMYSTSGAQEKDLLFIPATVEFQSSVVIVYEVAEAK